MSDDAIETDGSSPIGIPSKLTSSLESLRSAFGPLLSKPLDDSLNEMDPLERAKMDIMIAYTLVDLVWGESSMGK